MKYTLIAGGVIVAILGVRGVVKSRQRPDVSVPNVPPATSTAPTSSTPSTQSVTQPSTQPRSVTETFLQRPEVRVIDDDAVLGVAEAPVTLVEFSDFQCQFCTRFFKQTESALKEKYIKTGKVKFVYRDLVINGRESENAALAAECAGEQNKYWEYHDRLFNERRGYNLGVFVRDNLIRFASDLGLNMPQFTQCYDSQKYFEEIAKDTRDAVELGFRGTPSFWLNGRLLSGALPLATFEQLIEQELWTP